MESVCASLFSVKILNICQITSLKHSQLHLKWKLNIGAWYFLKWQQPKLAGIICKRKSQLDLPEKYNVSIVFDTLINVYNVYGSVKISYSSSLILKVIFKIN